MELFRTNEFYIFVNGEYSLWWDRQTGAFIPKTGWDLTDADDPVCLGICDGIVGKVEHPAVFDPRILLIKESQSVGKLHGDNEVYKIKSVVFLPFGPENIDLNLRQCQKHKSISDPRKPSNNPLFDIQKSPAFSKTWGTLKNAGNTIKNTTQQAAAIATGTPKRRDFKDKEKFERQIIDEFYKMFTDTNSFYYSKTTDITNSLQRLCELEKKSSLRGRPLWKTVDDRFFWNKHMLKDLIELENRLVDPWILPIIQGYIQIENCKVNLNKDTFMKSDKAYEIFTLGILSRRSRHRAGTRYKRRGVNENGECANYVETEQLIAYDTHEVSFVQVRGSVPVYWSQPGYKYRPPPRIDKGETDTKAAFEKHFETELKQYGPICVVNLIDQTGKEKIIFDAYSHYILQYNNPDVTYVTFDFHEYCRGMHFENVSILLSAISDVLKDMNYCWRDKQGHICSQNGVFRVNCIDCLDRTNVVQTALGKAVMEIQFCKLGLISPEGAMPSSIKNTFQLLWANNGDTISKQYAGTNALKGDYTRTGERKFTGIMKDGMNSANRYYKNHFKDSIRQCCLDIVHGRCLSQLELSDFWAYIRTFGNIASEYMPAESTPTLTPHFTLQQEFELANVVYQMTRYYLSRFKDTTRQGTIDLMLGNCVNEDIFNESKVQYEEDSVATAEHVKLLIEDCKKMLINQPEYILGSWGLINADPQTGDPSETEMDSILILTKDSYFVADYDDQVDKITKFQKVLLKDVDLLESGMPETFNTLFKSIKNRFCIRINYKVDNVSGYYHMFRSTNLRFFNNMAVVIKNEEEEIESLKAICEAFIVALDIGNLPAVPFNQGRSLDRRKSRVLSTGRASGNMYLDIVGLPQMTRNVSEGQLLSLKNVGTKALSNMTQQFSKLNKISSSFKPRNRKPNFTIGFNNKNETSSESEEEYENSIFQPNISIESGNSLQYATDSSSNSSNHNRSIEQGMEITEDSVLNTTKVSDTTIIETFLPSVGIVMGSKNESTNKDCEGTLEQKQNLLSRKDSAQVGDVQLSSIMQIQNNPFAPEIQINSEGCDTKKQQAPNSLKLDRKLSHSSGEVDDTKEPGAIITSSGGTEMLRFDKRSNSDYEVAGLNISQSQSESALKNKLTNLTSPVTNVTKDLVFNPFSKLAKGVQNLGANLDPRKLSGGQVRQVTEKEMEDHRKLQEKWQNSKTRLIAL